MELLQGEFLWAAPMPTAQPTPAPVAPAPVAQPTPQAMPAPAYDFVNNAGMPQAPQAMPAAAPMPAAQPVFNQSVANAAAQQQYAPQAAATTAPNVTTYYIDR